MGNGVVGVKADILPSLDKRLREFAISAIKYGMTQNDPALMNHAKKLGLVEAVHCTDENIELWEHLPVELGDDIYTLIKELD